MQVTKIKHNVEWNLPTHIIYCEYTMIIGNREKKLYFINLFLLFCYLKIIDNDFYQILTWILKIYLLQYSN